MYMLQKRTSSTAMNMLLHTEHVSVSKASEHDMNICKN